MAKETQLARVVAPNINDVNYVDSLKHSFDTINENFAKIASLPFLQGVQGDSYQIITKPIWVEGELTKEGALLLSAIFGIELHEDDTYSFVDGKVPKLNGKSPLSFWGDVLENPVKNDLYFQVIINDEGEEVESSKTAGQFYYFIDPCLNEVGNIYHGDNPSVLETYKDYSGFYQYVPEHEDENTPAIIEAHFEKADLLPSIYYDKDRNDICWKFNGLETGISAIGAPGSNGKDASSVYVKVADTVNPFGVTKASVTAVYNPTKLGSESHIDDWVNPGDEHFAELIKEGFATIVFKNRGIAPNNNPPEGEPEYLYAFGYVKKDGTSSDEYSAYWTNELILNKIVGHFCVSDFFNSMGVNDINAQYSAIYIPSVGDASCEDQKKYFHTIGTQYIKGQNTTHDLIFRHVKSADTTKGPDQKSGQKNIILDNYNLKLNPCANPDTNQKGGPFTTANNTEITNEQISINNGVTPKIRLSWKSESVIGDQGLKVVGKLTNVGPVLLNAGSSGTDRDTTTIYGKTTISADTTINKTLTVNGKTKLNGDTEVNASATINGNVVTGGNIIFKNGATSGNAVKIIKINENGSSDRHLDVVSDGVYIYKTQYGKGGASLFVDGDITTNSNLYLKNPSLSQKYGITLRGDKYLRIYSPFTNDGGVQLNVGNEYFSNAVAGVLVEKDEVYIKPKLYVKGGATIDGNLSVNGGATIDGGISVLNGVCSSTLSWGNYTKAANWAFERTTWGSQLVHIPKGSFAYIDATDNNGEHRAFRFPAKYYGSGGCVFMKISFAYYDYLTMWFDNGNSSIDNWTKIATGVHAGGIDGVWVLRFSTTTFYRDGVKYRALSNLDRII